VPPYYVFLCRPTLGNKPYAVPIEKAFDIFDAARMRCSGLAKRARLVMSHESGKIEVLGVTEDQTFFKFMRSAFSENDGRFLAMESNPKAYWFDDYENSEQFSDQLAISGNGHER